MQKVFVLYTCDGAILSIGAPLEPGVDNDRLKFGPLAAEGQHATELEVPAEFRQMGLASIAEQLRVDVRGAEHRLARKH